MVQSVKRRVFHVSRIERFNIRDDLFQKIRRSRNRKTPGTFIYADIFLKGRSKKAACRSGRKVFKAYQSGFGYIREVFRRRIRVEDQVVARLFKRLVSGARQHQIQRLVKRDLIKSNRNNTLHAGTGDYVLIRLCGYVFQGLTQISLEEDVIDHLPVLGMRGVHDRQLTNAYCNNLQ